MKPIPYEGDVVIVCPTHGRAGRVKTFKTFGPDLLLSVAESQVPAYREAYPDAKIDPHPDTIVGLAPKKQHLYEKFGSLFMVDDDATEMIDHVEGGKLDWKKARAVVGRLADMAAQIGAFHWGFTMDVKPLYYSPQMPFRLTGMATGGTFGLHPGSKLWYPNDPELSFWEDLWIAGLNAYFHRYCLVDNRYALRPEQGAVGGLANIRTKKRIYAQCPKLTAAFGDAVTFNDDAPLYPWNFRVPWT